MNLINKFIESIDAKMESKGEKSKALWQFIKFNLVSFIASVIQISLSYLLLALLTSWKSGLPGFLTTIFNEEVLGEGNANWGYVLPFFLSNLAANIFAYLMNQKTTFKSDAPKINLIIYIVIMMLLILFSTWLQGVIVNAIRSSISPFWQSLKGMAPTIAALSASTVQFLILFPLEKFILLKEKTDQ